MKDGFDNSLKSRHCFLKTFRNHFRVAKENDEDPFTDNTVVLHKYFIEVRYFVSVLS